MPTLRPSRWHPMPSGLFKPVAADQSSTPTLPSSPPFFSTPPLDHGRRHWIKGRAARAPKGPWSMEVGVEVAEEGATVVVPRARRRHPPVDTEDIVDGAVRIAMLAAGGIGSRSQHRHHLRLLPLPPRRPSTSLLIGSSSASPSTTAPTRTLSGYPASSARSLASGRTRSC
jgi:hypothetical protein